MTATKCNDFNTFWFLLFPNLDWLFNTC